jgi:hypothetical protein
MQEGSFTVLHAAQNCDTERADFLTDHGADPHSATDDGHIAADLAAVAGDSTLATCLRA